MALLLVLGIGGVGGGALYEAAGAMPIPEGRQIVGVLRQDYVAVHDRSAPVLAGPEPRTSHVSLPDLDMGCGSTWSAPGVAFFDSAARSPA